MQIEIRAENMAIITGYVNVVERESRLLHDSRGAFIEVVKAGTFQKALEKASNVELRFNHSKLLGGTADGNLELREDSIGLYAKATITDQAVIADAKSGKLSGWSFGFHAITDSWETRSDGKNMRYLEDIDLSEVSILNVTPAYIATSVEMRDGEAHLNEFRQCDEKVDVIDDQKPANPPAPNKDDELRTLADMRRKFEFECLVKKG